MHCGRIWVHTLSRLYCPRDVTVRILHRRANCVHCAGSGQAAAQALHRSSLQGVRLTVANARASAPSRRNRLVVKAAQLLGGKKVNKVVLAYSGGLDTSVILTWLKETYDCEVVTFTADLGQVCTANISKGLPVGTLRVAAQSNAAAGQLQLVAHAFNGSSERHFGKNLDLQGEELEPARKRAEEFGVKEIYIDDLREEFVRDYVFPMFR